MCVCFNQNSTASTYICTSIWWSTSSLRLNDKDKSAHVSSLSAFGVGQSTYSTLSTFCIISRCLEKRREERKWVLTLCIGQFQTSFFSLFRFHRDVPREHLSCVIHLHCWAIIHSLKKEREKRGERESESAVAKAIKRIHIPFPFIWASYCHNTWRDSAFSIVVISFFIRCDADISLWEAIIRHPCLLTQWKSACRFAFFIFSIVIQYWFTICSSWFHCRFVS